MSYVPYSLGHFIIWSSVGSIFGEVYGGRDFLGEVWYRWQVLSEIQSLYLFLASSFCSLLVVRCGPRCEFQAFCSCHHACCLLPCLCPATMNSHLCTNVNQNKCFIIATEKYLKHSVLSFNVHARVCVCVCLSACVWMSIVHMPVCTFVEGWSWHIL